MFIICLLALYCAEKKIMNYLEYQAWKNINLTAILSNAVRFHEESKEFNYRAGISMNRKNSFSDEKSKY